VSLVNMPGRQHSRLSPQPSITRSLTLRHTQGATTWPIVMFVHALFYQDQSQTGARGAALAGWMQYINSDAGQAIPSRFGFVPLVAPVRAVNAASLNSMILAPGYTPSSYTPPATTPAPSGLANPNDGAIASIILMMILACVLLGAILYRLFIQFREEREFTY